MKKVLIVGYGSIGKRHARILKQEGAHVALVTSQTNLEFEAYPSLQEALKNISPDIVIVANETSKHLTVLNELTAIGYRKEVCVEKPLFEKQTIIQHSFNGLYVLYNLRHSPLLIELKKKLEGQKVITANVYCGQYLPSWRPDRDYRSIYSAHKNEGGGVIRDLSHELDYASWLFGSYREICAIGGHFSSLEITSDDVFHLLGRSEKSSIVNISVNYLDRSPKRTIIVNTNESTFTIDFIKGEIWENDKLVLGDVKTADTYNIQARNILDGKFENFCTQDEANQVMRLIEIAEESSLEKRFKKL